MNHAVKTLIFAGVAAVVTLIAVFTYPRQESFKAPDLVGKPLFKDFTDPESAAELKIVKFDEDVAELTEFDVTRDAKSGLWVIPSSSNYPADAENQMRDAATALIDLEVIGVQSENASDQALYGVVEPDKEKLDASQKGVGLLVNVQNTKGKQLARLIIGKAVKQNEGLHFVRIPGQNVIYVVKIDPAKFPTDFEKWIERDLLKINTFDVARVSLKDYSTITSKSITGQTMLDKFEQRFEADIRWDADKSEWKLDKLVEYRDDQPHETKLLDTEELNKKKLDDLKTALGDLKIVGVVRKPKGLGAALKAGAEIMKNNESLVSLMNRGFFPIPTSNGAAELRAANGEVVVGVKDGVEYVLRFGEMAGVDKSSAEGKLNRYLFVSARLDQSAFPPLKLEPLPEGDDDAKKDAKADEKKAADAKAVDEKKAAASKDKADTEKTDLELERDRIRKENQRKKDERAEKLKKANQKVAELNARFADWYYIISEDEYKKIHLRRDDLIKEKESAKKEGVGADSFRKLKDEGLKKKKPADTKSNANSPMPAGMGHQP